MNASTTEDDDDDDAATARDAAATRRGCLTDASIFVLPINTIQSLPSRQSLNKRCDMYRNEDGVSQSGEDATNVGLDPAEMMGRGECM